MSRITNGSYCVTLQNEFQIPYMQYHGYIALIISLFGCIANSINIIVLSRKQMASSVNFVLTGLAVADLLVMIEYIPFALYNYTNLLTSGIHKSKYGWTVLVYFHVVFSQVVHLIAIWLTMTLAVLRYIAIKLPLKSKTLCSKKNTNIAIGMAFAVCPLLCIPIIVATRIKAIPLHIVRSYSKFLNGQSSDEPLYRVVMTENAHLLTFTFWVYSVFMKLIPCVVLSILSILLILTMNSSQRTRQILTNNMALENIEEINSQQNCSGSTSRSGKIQIDRTTRMLVVLLVLFLLTELPPAVLGLLSAIAPNLFNKCFFALGEIMDLMVLIGCAVNFLLYCSMSRKFRRTFTRLARKMLFEGERVKQSFTRGNNTGPTFTTNF